MNPQDFIQVLTHQKAVSSLNEDELRFLLNEYPYYKEAQVALAQLMHEKNHLHFHKQLRIAAIHVNDRKSLYNLIYKPALQQTIETYSKITEEIVPDETEAQSSTGVDEQEIREAFNTPIPITQLGSHSKKGEPVEQPQSEQDKETSDLKVHEQEERDLGLLEKEILSHAFSLETSYDSFVEEEPSSDETKKPTSEKDLQIEAAKNLSEWLHQLDRKRQTPPKEESKEIIDSFIESQPQISRSERSEFFSPTNAAKMSIVDSEEFVTETLAKIYANQGNKEKAISVYKKLMLKYPEKKTYFAALIEKLK